MKKRGDKWVGRKGREGGRGKRDREMKKGEQEERWI
jgi:hypothetical protein